MGSISGYNIRMKENEFNPTLLIFLLVSCSSICAIGACVAIFGNILEAL